MADEINAATQIAVLYLKPAYVTPNLLGQSALALIQQGPLAPWRMAQSARLYKALNPEQRAKIRGAIGQGLAHAAPVERARVFRGTRDKLAGAYSKVLDSPFRWPAFIHEARLLGYDSPAKIRALLDDAKHTDDLVEVAQRTRQAMVDYSEMSAWEQKFLRRVVFFWPWVRGSATYTFRFARDHPLLADSLAQLAREGAEQAGQDLGDVPWYARGIFKVGEDAKGRPLVANPRAAQLFESPVQGFEAAKGLVSRDPRAGYRLTDFLSPAVRAPLQALMPHDPLGGYPLDSPAEGLKREMVESLPQYRLTKELRNPNADDEDVLYPTSRKGALAKFGVGTIFPRPVNPKELNERAREEGEASLSPAERKYRGVFAERNAFFKQAKRLMPEALEDGKLPKPLQQAFNRKAQRFAEYARAEGKKDGDLTQRDRYSIDVSLFVDWGLTSREEARAALDWMRSASEEEVREIRRRWSSANDGLHRRAYLETIGFARDALEAKGATELPSYP